MKKFIILLAAIVSFAASLIAQPVTVAVTPPIGCPNTTHDVSVTITNNSGASIPGGFTYTITLAVKDDGGSTLKTFTNSYSDGFSNGTSKTYLVTNVPFAGPMTCTVDGTISGMLGPTPYSYSATQKLHGSLPSNTYHYRKHARRSKCG